MNAMGRSRPGRPVVAVLALVVLVLSACSATPSGTGPNAPSPLPAGVRPLTPGPPAEPPARICQESVLDGPAEPPPGAIRVDPGADLVALTGRSPAGSTFWLAPGAHRFTHAVVPKDGDSYLGAPGAVVDGGDTTEVAFLEDYFGRKAANVRLAYLTITHFTSGAPDQGAVYAGRGWRIDHSTFRQNGYVALFAGTESRIDDSCFERNGQLAIGTYRFGESARDITIDHNEFRGNNTRNLQDCGCGGGVKWWETRNSRFTDNWVHDNKGAGFWTDNNSAGILVAGNYIDDNDNEGIFVEVSYNFRISDNTLVRNALVKGRRKDGNFPIGAIYISESGGVPIPGLPYSESEIEHNYLADNWDGVALWQAGGRYAGTDGPGRAPAFGDRVRWKTQNVSVHDNEFHMNKAAARCSGDPNCGRNGLFSNWVPVPGPAISPNSSHQRFQVAVTFDQNNVFAHNAYFGDWAFVGYDESLRYDWATWRGPKPSPASSFHYANPGRDGFGQDADSTMSPEP